MKELKRFRQFLAEGEINEVNPATIELLNKYTPEEVPGSWDDVNNKFVVPLDTEQLVWSEEDIDDMFVVDGVSVKDDLPKEYIEIDSYNVDKDTGGDNKLMAKNFAKYVPGKGIYYRFTLSEK